MDLNAQRPLLRILGGAVCLVALISMWSAVAPVSVAAAQSDLGFTSDSTWQADPVAARVHVLAVVKVTSRTVDVGDRRYFYDRIQLTAPPSAAGFIATTSGTPLPVSVLSTSTSSTVLLVGLGQRLYSGQSTTFDLKFDLVDNGGSTDRDLRIGHDLMSFPVVAFGSPNTPGSTVTVVFPPDFTVQEEFGDLTRAVYGSGEVVFSSGPVDDSTQLSAWFTAVKPVPPGSYRLRSFVLGSLSIALRYWADDPGWADQVERVMRSGYPLMYDMIGLGDPIGTTFTIEEASSQEIGGFSASYDEASGQVRVSYFADPFVILHETAHMWFNGDLLSDRWAEEAFASYYARAVVERLGLTDHAPQLTDRLRPAAVPFNDWLSTGNASSATDAYLYGATLLVARQIAAEAGDDGLQVVWRAARSGTAAFQPIHGPATESVGGGPADWRRLLDLLELTTGQSYSDIWRQWVVSASQESNLDQRDSALTTYYDMQRTAGAWDLPPEIRRAMDIWQFPQAVVFLGQARNLLSQRDQIVAGAATEQTTAPPTLRAAFEHSGIVVATAEASAELAVLNELSAARQARTQNGDAARALGLIGADPEADVVAAREAFAKGDTARALTLATNARTAWQSAAGAGQARIFGALCVLVGILLLGAMTFMSRRTAAAKAGGVSTEADAEHPAAGTFGSRARQVLSGRLAPVARLSEPVVENLQRHATPAIAAIKALPNGVAGRVARAASDVRTARVAKADSTLPPAPEKTHGDSVKNGSDISPSNGNGRSHDDATTAGLGRPVIEDGSSESAYDLLTRGHALLEDRHNAQAAVVLERASRLEPNKGSILEALGRAYFNSGQHARAAETFEALLEIDPTAHYGHFALGLSFSRLGRPAEARTHLRMAAALDPASDTYRRALEKAEAPKG
jgi:tetratricopeptide (TPR) repeat protein